MANEVIGIRTYNENGQLLIDHTTLLSLLDGSINFYYKSIPGGSVLPAGGYVEYDKTRGEPFFFVMQENDQQHLENAPEIDHVYNLFRFSLIEILPIFNINTALGRIEWSYERAGYNNYTVVFAPCILYYGTI